MGVDCATAEVTEGCGMAAKALGRLGRVELVVLESPPNCPFLVQQWEVARRGHWQGQKWGILSYYEEEVEEGWGPQYGVW